MMGSRIHPARYPHGESGLGARWINVRRGPTGASAACPGHGPPTDALIRPSSAFAACAGARSRR